MINVSEHPTLAHSLSSKRLKTPKEMQTPPIVDRNGYHNQVPALKPTVQCFSVKNKGPQSSSQYKSPFAYQGLTTVTAAANKVKIESRRDPRGTSTSSSQKHHHQPSSLQVSTVSLKQGITLETNFVKKLISTKRDTDQSFETLRRSIHGDKSSYHHQRLISSATALPIYSQHSHKQSKSKPILIQ